MSNNENDSRLNRRKFLRASGAAGATFASTKTVAAKVKNKCHFVEVGIDSDVILPSDANYAPLYHHNDIFKRHQLRAGKLELPNQGASQLKEMAKSSDRLADAANYEQFPGIIDSASPTNFIPILTNPDLRPTKVVQIEDEYRPPTVRLDDIGTKIEATIGGSTVEIAAGSERAATVESFASRLKVAERKNGELETYQKELEIQPRVVIRNHGEVEVVEQN